MDTILWAIGVAMRFPFYVIGVVIVTAIAVPLTLLVGVWWVVIVPILWVVTVPFRLFNLPRKGAAAALKSKLGNDLSGWRRAFSNWFRDVGNNYRALGHFLLKTRR